MMPVYDIQPPLELLKNGKTAEAIPMLEFLAKQMPSHVSCHVLLAQAYVQEERWQEALSSWQNASFLMPNSPVIRKGFREVLSILSRQTIKLIAAAPEASVERNARRKSEIEKTKRAGDYKASNVFSHRVPPALEHLVSDGDGIGADLELDDLINELESARIVPRPDHESIEAPALETDVEDMVSETLARIYEGQKQFNEAARVYDKLATMQPDRAADFERRAVELRSRSMDKAE